jgi:hypothetical protein
VRAEDDGDASARLAEYETLDRRDEADDALAHLAVRMCRAHRVLVNGYCRYTRDLVYWLNETWLPVDDAADTKHPASEPRAYRPRTVAFAMRTTDLTPGLRAWVDVIVLPPPVDRLHLKEALAAWLWLKPIQPLLRAAESAVSEGAAPVIDTRDHTLTRLDLEHDVRDDADQNRSGSGSGSSSTSSKVM